MIKKKKILWHSNYPAAKTGLGKNTLNVLKYLYSTNKYNILSYAQGMPYENQDYSRWPWETKGCLPMNQQEIEILNKDPNNARAASYGAYMIDRIIKDFKPDIYIGSDDFWAFTGYYDKSWWNKTNCVLHITLDSLPILPDAVNNANKINNYFVWAEFAEKEMKRLGHNHVKTIHGAIDDTFFFRKSDQERRELRKRHNLDQDTFIFGFVFRNQLRKEIIPLMEGFKEFKRMMPNVKSKLLLHTNLTEGWDINRAAEEIGLDKKDILVTYICKACKDIEVRELGLGQDLNCRFCGAEKSQTSPNVMFGATDDQLNDIYNLMDGYFQLANAGGLEIPLVEALYTELLCATVNYSFGETFCANDFIYEVDCDLNTRQIGTNFKRATPRPFSIAKTMRKMYDAKNKNEIGKKGRAWAISQFSVNIVGKKWEELFDSLPETDYDFEFDKIKKNPNYNPPEIEDNCKWLIDIYKNILNMSLDHTDDGHRFWMSRLENGLSRDEILKYFKSVATQDLARDKKVSFEELLGPESDKERILVEMKESNGDIFMVTSLLPSIKKQYPNHKIYFCCDQKYFELLDGNPYIDGLIPWIPEMESEPTLCGVGNHAGFFDRVFLLNISTQRHLSYLLRGSSDNIQLDIHSDDFNKYSF